MTLRFWADNKMQLVTLNVKHCTNNVMTTGNTTSKVKSQYLVGEMINLCRWMWRRRNSASCWKRYPVISSHSPAEKMKAVVWEERDTPTTKPNPTLENKQHTNIRMEISNPGEPHTRLRSAYTCYIRFCKIIDLLPNDELHSFPLHSIGMATKELYKSYVERILDMNPDDMKKYVSDDRCTVRSKNIQQFYS